MLADGVGALDRLAHFIEDMICEERQLAVADARANPGWSPAGYPFIARNEPVQFGIDHDGEPYLASGWWGPEPWGVWGREGPQTVRFALAAYRGGYVDITVTLQCYAPPAFDRPNVDICANGFFLGTFSVMGVPQAVKLRLSPACIGDGDILLHMALHRQHSPAALGDNHDERTLGVGIIALMMN